MAGLSAWVMNQELVKLGYASSPEINSLGWGYFSWETQDGVAKLNRAITDMVNKFADLDVVKAWDDGSAVATDGTMVDTYLDNLLAETSIRYGGLGGIAYHYVSDLYIALFSRFIPCVAWEAIYIIDGLPANVSDVKPSTIHADTQGQSFPVFTVAHLFEFDLMPRIWNWKDLIFFRRSTLNLPASTSARWNWPRRAGGTPRTPRSSSASSSSATSRPLACPLPLSGLLSPVRGDGREADLGGEPAVLTGIDEQLGPVGFGDRLDDGQPEAKTVVLAGAAGGDALERL
jgi:hypothetical protein